MTRRLIENPHSFWPIVKPGRLVTLAGFTPRSLAFDARAVTHGASAAGADPGIVLPSMVRTVFPVFGVAGNGTRC